MPHGTRMTKKQIDKISDAASLNPALSDALCIPEATIERRLMFRRDTGEMEYIPSWRCQHSTWLGPGKGGIRFHPSVTRSEVCALAFKMTLKNALLELPFGGAKSGVPINASELSEREREYLCRAWVRAYYGDIGPDKDIPAPDVGTGPAEMAWIRDEYEQLTGTSVPNIVTGKPISLGGLQLREGATARGGTRVLKTLQSQLNLSPANTRVAIQGFGKVGAKMATYLAQEGYTIVALADSSGTVFNQDGIDPSSIEEIKKQGIQLGKTGDELGKQLGSGQDVLTVDCDLLVPAALGGQITSKNAAEIKAKIVLEMANGGVSRDGNDSLSDRSIAVVPDILVNAGGVLASYQEWLSGKTGKDVVVEKAEKRLDDAIAHAAELAWKLHEKTGDNFTTACRALALRHIERVACHRSVF